MKNSVATIATDEKNPSILTFTFGDGESIQCDIASLPDTQKLNLLMLGAKNKLRDSYASIKRDEPAKAREAVQAVMSNLVNDKWVAARAKGAARTNTLLAQAIAELQNLDIEAVTATIAQSPAEKVASWRKNSQVKAKMLEIKVRNAQADENPEELDFTIAKKGKGS